MVSAIEESVRGRKLPQYLAVYVGACVGFLQLLDIAVERLPLQPRWFTIAFIACALGLPLVVAAALLRELSAKDRSTRARHSRRSIIGWSAIVTFLLIAAVAAPRAAAHWSRETANSRGGAVLITGFTSRLADSTLASVLTEALIVDFENDETTPLIEHTDLRHVLALDGLMLEGPLTREQALRYAGRAGASGIVQAEVTSAGPSYLLLARLLTPAGETVRSVRAAAPSEPELWGALDDVSRQLRSAARVLPRAPGADAVIPEVPASYVTAVRALRAGDAAAAERALQETLDADSMFVPALRTLGELLYARADSATGRTLLTAARAGAESLSGPERHLALASYYLHVEDDPQRASVNYRRVLELDPAESIARERLATLKAAGS